MNTYTAQRVGLAAITAATLGAVLFGTVSCQPTTEPTPSRTERHVTVLEPCEAASRIQDYTVRYEDGTTVYVTPREAVRQSAWSVAKGSITPAQHKRACEKIVRQAVKDGQSVR